MATERKESRLLLLLLLKDTRGKKAIGPTRLQNRRLASAVGLGICWTQAHAGKSLVQRNIGKCMPEKDSLKLKSNVVSDSLFVRNS